MAMAPTPASSNYSPILALPLEIRRHIYRFCIPQNLRFDCSQDMYHQNRPGDWIDPPWHWDKTCDRYGETSAVYASYKNEDDGLLHDWESDGVSVTGVYSDDDNNQGIFGEHGGGQLSSGPSALPGILLLCHQVSNEVEEMLYGGNIFEVTIHGEGESNLANMFSPKTREKMRKVLLVLRPMGISYEPGFRMDPNIWDNILRGLSILGIIAEQPEPPASYDWSRVEPEAVLGEWIAWLTPILQYLARALPVGVEIVVDANNEAETIHVLEMTLPGRCRFERLPVADLIFKRREDSWETSYWDDEGSMSCRYVIDDRDCEYYYYD